MEPYHELQGLISLKQQDYQASINHYRQADLSTTPDVSDVKNIYMLARALQGAGMTDEAGRIPETRISPGNRRQRRPTGGASWRHGKANMQKRRHWLKSLPPYWPMTTIHARWSLITSCKG